MVIDDCNDYCGGIIIWNNEYNFIHHYVAFDSEQKLVRCESSKSNTYGIHPFISDKAWLRLERKGDRIAGYISSDSKDWYICGLADMPMEDSIKVGIYARCPESSTGTYTKFGYFKLYKPSQM